jgi:hypothetical protein
MTHERIEQAAGGLPEDEARYVARPLPPASPRPVSAWEPATASRTASCRDAGLVAVGLVAVVTRQRRLHAARREGPNRGSPVGTASPSASPPGSPGAAG